jgi:DNA invertase Pin-like site-specific DNA recombinase
MVRDMLDALVPEPIADVLEGQAAQRAVVRRALTRLHRGTVRLVGYRLLSTEEHAEGGQSLDAQARTIRAAVKASGDTLVDVCRDAGESGKDLHRRELQRGLQMLADGGADGLIAVALDRLTRDTRGMADLMEWFAHHRYTLRLLDVDVDSSTAAGEVVPRRRTRSRREAGMMASSLLAPIFVAYV